MTRTGHRASSFGAAAIAFSITHSFRGEPWLAALTALFGATAPDWLEVVWFERGWRRSLIPHRTLTHWLPMWGAALAWSWLSLAQTQWASALLGFAVGGLLHLLLDLPNPSGIQVLHPFGRPVSLNWWRADQMVWPLVLLTWVAGICALDRAGLVSPRLKVLIEPLFAAVAFGFDGLQHWLLAALQPA